MLFLIQKYSDNHRLLGLLRKLEVEINTLIQFLLNRTNLYLSGVRLFYLEPVLSRCQVRIIDYLKTPVTGLPKGKIIPET